LIPVDLQGNNKASTGGYNIWIFRAFQWTWNKRGKSLSTRYKRTSTS